MKIRLGACRFCGKRGARLRQDPDGTWAIACPQCPHAVSNSKTAESAARIWNTGKCQHPDICGCPF